MTSESPSPRTEGAALMQAVAGGDTRALTLLYDRHAGLAYSLCTLILGNVADAEEAVMDTFLQVWRTAARFDPDRGSVTAWIVTIARSRALDLLRQRARRVRDVDDTAAPAGATATADAPAASRLLPDVSQIDARQMTSWALEQLSPAQREAVELAYLDGLTHSEIARRLGTPVGTIKTRLRDGMKKLRTTLAAPRETLPQ